jgi:hypothetical protein
MRRYGVRRNWSPYFKALYSLGAVKGKIPRRTFLLPPLSFVQPPNNDDDDENNNTDGSTEFQFLRVLP